MNTVIKKITVLILLTIPFLYFAIDYQDIVNQVKSDEYSLGIFLILLCYTGLYVFGIGVFIVNFIIDFLLPMLDNPLTKKYEAILLKLALFLKLYKMRSLRGGIAFSTITIFVLLSQFMINHNYGVLLIAILGVTALFGLFYIGIPIIGSVIIFTIKALLLIVKGDRDKIKELFEEEFRIITILKDK